MRSNFFERWIEIMILFFTGTGNSRYIAEKIAKKTCDDMICINERIKQNDASSIRVSGDLIIVTPTYAWRIPNLVKEWLLQMSFIDVERVWFVMNCGDSIGKADRYNRELCMKKDWKYMGTIQIIMPENYIAMFPVPDEKEAEKIIAAADVTIEEAISCIQLAKRFPERKNHLWDGLLSGLVNQLFYPLFVKATPFYAKDYCIGCGKCASLCPLNNIQLEKGKPVWGNECTHCMACICCCPEEAIEYGKKSEGKVRYHCK